MLLSRSELPQDEEHLGWLASQFRGAREKADRDVIAREYAETVDRLIQSNQWNEMPAPEDQLPDAWMPKMFFDYWLQRQISPSNRQP